MSILSDRILNMQESATIAMAAKSREMKARGIDVISLSLGEPDFNTPEHIKEAAKQAVDDNFSHYTPVPGYLDLREAISEKFKRDNGLDYEPSQIVTSTGAKQTLANLMFCLINPGDEVILPAPYWVSYEGQILLARGKVVRISTNIDSDFKITPAQLEASITDKTKAFLFSSPCNPSGSVYSQEELNGLAEVLAKYPNIVVIADEIYEFINYTDKHASIGANPLIKDRVVTVNGLSKGFAMTGWRLGYMGAPKEIAAACTKMQGQFTSGTCAITQRAAITALNSHYEPTLAMKAEFLKRRNLVADRLREIPGLKFNVPDGAFYFFPDASAYFGKSYGNYTINNITDLCMYLLETANVATVTGAAFGNDDCFRIAYATSTDLLEKATARMKDSLSKLA